MEPEVASKMFTDISSKVASESQLPGLSKYFADLFKGTAKTSRVHLYFKPTLIFPKLKGMPFHPDFAGEYNESYDKGTLLVLT